MSTSDTPISDNIMCFVKRAINAQETEKMVAYRDAVQAVIEALERQLNAARAELAERKSQPSGDERAAGAEALARQFHDTYERLAPAHGYETRKDTKTFDPEAANGKLMIAVCQQILAAHQPQGAPVAYRYKAVGIIDGVERVLIKEIDPNRQEYELVDSAHDYSHLSYPLNYPMTNDHEPLYTADQWPPSPCPHLSTSKEGTSYCTLAESSKANFDLMYQLNRALHIAKIHARTNAAEQVFDEAIAAIAAHQKKS